MSDPARPDEITIVLADDHQVVRNGIRMVLENEPDLEVVAEAGDADAARRYVLGHKPTVLVLDLNMPGLGSLEAIPAVYEASAETRVIILTMETDPRLARRALSGGAHAYVLKDAAASDLVAAIHSVVEGDVYVSPGLGAKLAALPADFETPDGLSPREIEVLELIALGHVNPEIAEKLALSVRTVETHRSSIQRKTGASTRAELTAYAIEHGLVDH